MSVWTTKNLGRDRELIVIRHPLRGVNNMINGVIFRESYGVVEKDSKTYHHLKKIPLLHKSEEYPLTHLKNLKFVTRVQDIKMVYGQDVYLAYLRAIEEAEQNKIKEELEAKAAMEAVEQARRKHELEQLAIAEAKMAEEASKLAEAMDKVDSLPDEAFGDVEIEVEELPKITKCCFVKNDGNLCKHDALDYSPSKYCSLHLLEDEKLSEHGITLPGKMTKNEKKKARKAVHRKLKALKAKGAF
jgi:hypothetical protein